MLCCKDERNTVFSTKSFPTKYFFNFELSPDPTISKVKLIKPSFFNLANASITVLWPLYFKLTLPIIPNLIKGLLKFTFLLVFMRLGFNNTFEQDSVLPFVGYFFCKNFSVTYITFFEFLTLFFIFNS